jgi:hypothetical protein
MRCWKGGGRAKLQGAHLRVFSHGDGGSDIRRRHQEDGQYHVGRVRRLGVESHDDQVVLRDGPQYRQSVALCERRRADSHLLRRLPCRVGRPLGSDVRTNACVRGTRCLAVGAPTFCASRAVYGVQARQTGLLHGDGQLVLGTHDTRAHEAGASQYFENRVHEASVVPDGMVSLVYVACICRCVRVYVWCTCVRVHVCTCARVYVCTCVCVSPSLSLSACFVRASWTKCGPTTCAYAHWKRKFDVPGVALTVHYVVVTSGTKQSPVRGLREREITDRHGRVTLPEHQHEDMVDVGVRNGRGSETLTGGMGETGRRG